MGGLLVAGWWTQPDYPYAKRRRTGRVTQGLTVTETLRGATAAAAAETGWGSVGAKVVAAGNRARPAGAHVSRVNMRRRAGGPS
ncbi:hypothetical protein D1Y84_09590 [Acidipila sp. EB88]|nr:hypothetical protein D1Y84_09590 [Acidipila sp. EB88]